MLFHIGDELKEQTDARVVRTRERVLEAAQRLLFDGGPSAITYSALAEEAGVGRTTLYRHWPTLDDLWAEVTAIVDTHTRIEFSGDLRQDLLTAMSIVASMARTDAGRASVASMLERSQWDDDTYNFAVRFQDQIPVQQALAKAVEVGTYPASDDLQVASSLLVGPLLLQSFFTRGQFDDSIIEYVVDRFIRSIAAG